MSFGGFVRKNLGPSLLGGGGALIGVWGFLGDARDLWTAGINPNYLQLSGFVLFVLATISVLYRQHQLLEERLAPPQTSARQDVIITPVVEPPPAAEKPAALL